MPTDATTDGGPGLVRPGHWPLIWLLLPIILGYVMGAGIDWRISPMWLSVSGMGVLLAALWLVRGKESLPYGLWGGMFIGGALLLGWAYWLMREPQPPSGFQLPPREAELSLRIDRLFADARHNGQVSGLATIEGPPKLLPELEGQRAFFVLWPEQFENDFAPGARVRVRGRLAVLESTDEDYGFNTFLIRSGVYYEFDPGSTLALEEQAPGYERLARSVNLRIRDSLRLGAESEEERSLAGISEAMLLGRKEALGRNQKERFIESGTMHLFAVSGLHIGVIAGVLFLIFDWINVPRPVSAVVGLALVGAYVMVVGHPPSALRAYLMVFAFWAAAAFERKPSPMSALLASAILVLLFNPQELLRPGFQLSYSVVGGILLYGVPLSRYLAERFRPYRFLPEDSWTRRQHLWAKACRWSLLTLGVSFSATLFSTPLTIAIFGVFTPGAILLNAFLLPLASLALIVAGASAVFGLVGVGPVSWAINHLCWGLNWLLEKSVDLGLLAPGLFHAAEWHYLPLAPITLCFMFLGYLTVLHLPNQRPWHFWTPPAILAVMLVLGLRLV